MKKDDLMFAQHRPYLTWHEKTEKQKQLFILRLVSKALNELLFTNVQEFRTWMKKTRYRIENEKS